MLFRITSHLGDHNAVLEDVKNQKMIFDKLSGKIEEPLPKEVIPDTFEDLQFLWNKGKCNYTPITKDENKDISIIKEFDPNIKEITFLAPIIGG